MATSGKTRLAGLVACTLLLFCVPRASAQDDAVVINAPVTDRAGVLSEPGVDRISGLLRAHHTSTGVQLAVLVVDTTSGAPIEDFALRVATRWRGGDEDRDDGALFVLAVSDRRMRLEVGYGLEASVPDARASRLVRTAIPFLRTGDYDGAVEGMVHAFIEATASGARATDAPETLRPGTSQSARPATRAPHAPRRQGEIDRYLATHRNLARSMGQVTWPGAPTAGAYAVLFLLGSLLGAVGRRRGARRETEARAESRTLELDLLALAWVVLFLGGSAVAAHQLDLGWFPLVGAGAGLIAGRSFLWSSAFKSFHYIVLVTILSVVAFVGVGMWIGSPGVGLWVAAAIQVVVTRLYAPRRSRGLRVGVLEFLLGEGNGLDDFDSFSSGRSGFSSGASHRSSSFGSSRGHSGGGSSRYSGGGGGFGGGGASSSW